MISVNSNVVIYYIINFVDNYWTGRKTNLKQDSMERINAF